MDKKKKMEEGCYTTIATYRSEEKRPREQEEKIHNMLSSLPPCT